jgi:hypothetical protein
VLTTSLSGKGVMDVTRDWREMVSIALMRAMA